MEPNVMHKGLIYYNVPIKLQYGPNIVHTT